MNLKTVSVKYERKVNMGDYNSIHVGVTLWADLDEGDDEAGATEALRNMARNQTMLELARVNATIAAKVENIFAGLPAEFKNGIGENHAD